MADTKEQFEKVISQCRELFEKKLKDYGPSWRIMRPNRYLLRQTGFAALR